MAVLRTILSHFGKDISAQDIRLLTGVSRDCLTAADIRRAATQLGLHCKAYSCEPDRLRSLPLPLVVHIRFIHFVVLEGIAGDSYHVNCPHSGRLKIPSAHFSEDFTGIALTFAPGPTFNRSPQDRLSPELALWTAFANRARVALGASLLLAAAGSMALAWTITQAFRDFAPATTGALASATAMALSLLMLRASARRTHIELRARVVDKLLAQPFSFYSYRLPSVLFDVAATTKTIPFELADRLGPVMIGTVSAATLLAAAATIDVHTGAAIAVGYIASCTAIIGLLGYRRTTERLYSSTASSAAETLAEALTNPAHAKLGNAPERLRQWLAARAANRQLGLLKLGSVPALTEAIPALLLAWCIGSVLFFSRGYDDPTTAALLLVSAALAWSVQPICRLRGFFDRVRRSTSSICDILGEVQEASERSAAPHPPLSGNALSVEQISFGFAPGRRQLIRDVSFNVASGEQIGITGPSGAGKSTLANIISGLDAANLGKVRIGGVALKDIPEFIRPHIVARIDRTPVFFEGSIHSNLRFFDETIDDEQLAAAVRDARLDEMISERAGGLDAFVEAHGRNFSGGQLQRLEIARALARNPRVVVLDDAMDALDFETERNIRAALRRRGCTVLVISHRASSLAICDRVLHFQSGRLVDAKEGIEPHTAESALPMHAQPRPFSAPPLSEQATADIFSAVSELAGSDAKPGHTPRALSKTDAIKAAATASGTQVRCIRFIDPAWWQFDVGRLLAFDKEGRAIAVSGNKRLRGLNGNFVELDRTAFAISKPAEFKGSSLRLWLATLFKSATGEVLRATLFAAVAASALVLVAFAASQDLTDIRTVIGAFTAGGALLTGWISWQIALSRVRARVDDNESIALSNLAVRVDAEAASTLRYGTLYRQIEGLSNLSLGAVDVLSRGLPAGFLLAGSLIFLGSMTNLALAGSTLAGALLLALFEFLLCQMRFRGFFALAPLRQSARHRLASLLYGIGKLKTLHATESAFKRWIADEDLISNAEAPVGITHVVSHPLRFVFVLVLSMMFMSATMTFTPAPLSVGPAIFIVVWSAQVIGGVLANVLAYARLSGACEFLSLARQNGRIKIKAADAVISADNISCGYAKSTRSVLSAASVDVDPRAVTVITGPSGSGKTTLLRVLMGFQKPSSGQVTVGGHPLASIAATDWQCRIAGVFQGDRIEDATTIRAHVSGYQDLDIAAVWEALDIVELSDDVKRMPMGLQTIVEATTLSGGQQQRLLLACAIAQHPSLLVMDEATNAIPDEMQSRIIARLRRNRVGCLIVTHRETLIRAADRVHVLDRGHVVFSGPPSDMPDDLDLKELMRHEQYS